MAHLPDHTITHDAGRVTVYLLHGIYGAKEYWRPLTRRLVAEGYRVIAWDAPGYGLSALDANHSFDSVAEAGARLVRATAGERNVIFGHSMGGQITPRLAGKVKDLVHAAVITATIGYFGNRTPEEQAAFVKARSAPPPPGTSPLDAQLALVNSMFGAGASGPDVDVVRQVAMQTPPAAVQASVKAVQAYKDEDAVGALRALHVPTLLVAGEVDKVGYAEGMRRLTALIPRSEFHVVSGAGHYPWAENPEEFTPILMQFLRQSVA
ncbi:alpha/beta fold hydrolase [Ramlibacter sp.]|uniref:alpha/beta fold hydrolase n=1 Tax=Ramlibacter sp. TaxID=1917967 RepID=UPI003D0B89F2